MKALALVLVCALACIAPVARAGTDCISAAGAVGPDLGLPQVARAIAQKRLNIAVVGSASSELNGPAGTNIELVFPIRPDFSMKGAVFYDGGAGWDTPVPVPPDSPFLRNNKFNYRQAVGVGLRMLSPVPVQIDWAFKLDRNKKQGESASELHLGMNHNF